MLTNNNELITVLQATFVYTNPKPFYEQGLPNCPPKFPVMTRLICFTASLFWLLASSAFAQNNSIVIASPDELAFNVFINGKLQNRQPTTSISIDGLDAASYELEINFEDHIRSIRQAVFLTDQGQQALNTEFLFTIVNRNRNPQLRFENLRPLNGNHDNDDYAYNEPTHHNRDAYDYGRREGHHAPPPMRGYNANYYRLLPMKSCDFRAALNDIRFKASDRDRLLIAKEVVAANYLTTGQVCDLLSLLTFDASKLELAKFAYTNTLDRGNYFKVKHTFSFRSTSDELNEYLRRCANR